MAKIIAFKKEDEVVIFDLPDKEEKEAIKYAKNSVRKIVKQLKKKRIYGWKFKIKE